ncbi:response regulator [Thioalkalicoccus limnaeus]|uniref:histidine kinase n=1 Tax=Thioalkalicoccus limnaeus TaxID=120681 RepID=A0ABV4BIP6_9GAMM
MALDLKKFIGRFVGEARDHLSRLEAGLADLIETGRLPPEQLDALFRSAHTIKGSARMLKLTGLAETANRVEDVLGAVRDGRIPTTSELGQRLMRAVDHLSRVVDRIEATEGNDQPCDASVNEDLLAASTGATEPGPKQIAVDAHPGTTTASTTEAAADGDGDGDGGEATSGPATLRASDQVRVRVAKLDELINLLGEVISSQTRLRHRLLEARALEARLRPLLTPLDRTGPGPAANAALHQFVLSLRELVQEQERLVGELNQRALTMRMLPLSTVLDPSARVARELARSLGREIHCEVRGGEIEIDRYIIDRLGDALVHLLRNAIDHGIEPPDERVAAGKPPIGHLRLIARQEGAGVLIEIADDGRGLDRDRIVAKAVQQGLIEPHRSIEISDDQLADLLCLPGFTTSPIITELSGRGVGLDAVKRAIHDELQGAMAVASRPGRGTKLTLRLPLSLALIRILLLRAGDQLFGLPAQHIVELILIDKAETIQVADRPAVVLRNEIVPLVALSDLLGDAGASAPISPDRATASRTRSLVVVLGLRQAKLGLVVDQIVDERDMIVKPLPDHLRDFGPVGGLVSGMVVTGDNDLVAVLQAPALLEIARQTRHQAVARRASRQGEARPPAAGQRILVVDDSLNTREIEKEILEAYGYRVTLAEDGLEGWQKALGGQFDAILTDVEMPGLDGFTLTAKLRENERYRATPIVIITSRQKEEDKQRGIQVGADAYIVKGAFDQSSLVETLRNLLG